MSETFRSGFVSFVGRPNAGKSTLINALVGTKVAITSRSAQTTRRPIRAIATGASYQLVAIDTPGLHKPVDPLGERLNEAALDSLGDGDAIVMVIDGAAPIGRGDEWVAERIRDRSCPKFCVLNKIDRANRELLEEQRARAEALADWAAIMTVSAKTGKGVEALKERLVAALPPGPAWFPSTMTSDQSLEATTAEIVREKLLRHLRDEVPHSIGVKTRSITYDEKRDLWSIETAIYVERPSQKAIVIGAGGRTIKRIGIEARADIEKLVRGRIFLDLKVEVKRHWRSDPAEIERFGYGLPS